MDRLIYLAMSGAKATLQRQDQLANNLANASTNGFRAELQAFRAVPVRGDGASTRVYALESSVGHDTRSGPVQTTGRALDVALQGAAWLAVQSLDGTSKMVTFTITGVNDAAVIGTPTVASVTEDASVNGSGNLTASGTLSVSDVDTGEAGFKTTVTSAAAG